MVELELETGVGAKRIVVPLASDFVLVEFVKDVDMDGADKADAVPFEEVVFTATEAEFVDEVVNKLPTVAFDMVEATTVGAAGHAQVLVVLLNH